MSSHLKPGRIVRSPATRWILIGVTLVALLIAAAFFVVSQLLQVFEAGREAGMKDAALRNRDAPLATYYLILKSYREGSAPEEAQIYGDLLKKSPGNSNLQSAFAFSQFWAVGRLAGRYLPPAEQKSPLVQSLLRQAPIAARADALARAARPDSPVILVETAVPLFFQHDEWEVGDHNEDKRAAVQYLRKAVQLAPDWGEASYWLGNLLRYQPFELNEPPREIARESLTALQTADRLEPQRHVDCLIGYAYDFQALGQPDKAVQYLNAWLQTRPDEAQKPEFIEWRSSLSREIGAS